MSLLRKYWFLAALGIAVALGCLFPAQGQNIRASIPYLVGTVMFLSGLTIDARNLLRQMRQPRGVLIAFCSIYLVAPLAGYLLARLLAPPASAPEFTQGIMVLSSQAGTIASALALTLLAGGNRELALLNTLLTNLSTALCTPLILKLSIGAEVEFEYLAMLGSIARTVLAPVLAGLLIRSILERVAGYRPGRRSLQAARMVSQCIILVFIFAGFARAAPRLGGELPVVLRILAAAVLLHAILLVVNWFLARQARLDLPSRAAVLFTGSQKTLPNGILIAEEFFPQNPYAALPLILYHALQLIVDTALASGLRTEKKK